MLACVGYIIPEYFRWPGYLSPEKASSSCLCVCVCFFVLLLEGIVCFFFFLLLPGASGFETGPGPVLFMI